MEGIYVCVGALIIVAPLALLVIGIVQLHTLKSTVRNLARRVEELESRAGGFVVTPPKPVADPNVTVPIVPSIVKPKGRVRAVAVMEFRQRGDRHRALALAVDLREAIAEQLHRCVKVRRIHRPATINECP